MPGRQLCLYDKTLEVSQKRLDYWWNIWGRRKEDGRVWRIEVRSGKEDLVREWRIRTWADLDASLSDVVMSTLSAIRMCDPRHRDANVSRRRPHPLWFALRDEMIAHLGERSGLVRGRQVVGKRKQLVDIYDGLIVGMAASLSVVMERQTENVVVHLFEALSDAMEDHEDWNRRVKQARKRIAIIDDWYYTGAREPNDPMPCVRSESLGEVQQSERPIHL